MFSIHLLHTQALNFKWCPGVFLFFFIQWQTCVTHCSTGTYFQSSETVYFYSWVDYMASVAVSNPQLSEWEDIHWCDITLDLTVHAIYSLFFRRSVSGQLLNYFISYHLRSCDHTYFWICNFLSTVFVVVLNSHWLI